VKIPKKWKPKSNMIKLEKVKVNGEWVEVEFTEEEECQLYTLTNVSNVVEQ